MLLVSYEGNSHFSVSICDVSACEIEYPSIPACSYGNLNAPRKEETENDDLILPPMSSIEKKMKTSVNENISQNLQEKTKTEGRKSKYRRCKII